MVHPGPDGTARVALWSLTLALAGTAVAAPGKAPSAAALNQDLLNAVERGQIPQVAELLRRGADANTYEGKPLAVAAGRGDLAMVKYLVQHGATVTIDFVDQGSVCCDPHDDRSRIGCGRERWEQHRTFPTVPALVAAAAGNHKSVVEYLLKKGAPLDGTSTSFREGRAAYCWTPLIAAVGGGAKDVAVLLLAAGADRAASFYLEPPAGEENPVGITLWGGTALDIARAQSDEAMIRLLAPDQADAIIDEVRRRDAERTAEEARQQAAAEAERERTLQREALVSQLRAAYFDGNDADVARVEKEFSKVGGLAEATDAMLKEALARRAFAVVDGFLAKGIDVAAKGGSEHHDASCGDVDCGSCEGGCDFSLPSPLELAASRGDLEAVRYLYAHAKKLGKDGAQRAFIRTFLESDCKALATPERAAVVALLLDKGAQPNLAFGPWYFAESSPQRDYNPVTALHRAVACCAEQVIDALLEHGALAAPPGR